MDREPGVTFGLLDVAHEQAQGAIAKSDWEMRRAYLNEAGRPRARGDGQAYAEADRCGSTYRYAARCALVHGHGRWHQDIYGKVWTADDVAWAEDQMRLVES